MSGKVKIAIFAVVVLAAAGIVVHSFLVKVGASANRSDQRIAIAARRERAAASEEARLENVPLGRGTSAVCGTMLNSIAALNKQAADKDFVFILLPGESKAPAEGAGKHVDEAVKTISARGVRVAAFTLGNEADGHAQLVARFAVKSFPSVIALGRGCAPVAVSAEVTEAKLLRAYVLASAPSTCGTPCGPSSGGTSCGPPSGGGR